MVSDSGVKCIHQNRILLLLFIQNRKPSCQSKRNYKICPCIKFQANPSKSVGKRDDWKWIFDSGVRCIRGKNPWPKAIKWMDRYERFKKKSSLSCFMLFLIFHNGPWKHKRRPENGRKVHNSGALLMIGCFTFWQKYSIEVWKELRELMEINIQDIRSSITL